LKFAHASASLVSGTFSICIALTCSKGKFITSLIVNEFAL
jgi:hypothetical protein